MIIFDNVLDNVSVDHVKKVALFQLWVKFEPFLWLKSLFGSKKKKQIIIFPPPPYIYVSGQTLNVLCINF